MGDSKFRVDLIPVHVLLEDDCLDALLQYAKFKAQVLDCHSFLIVHEQLLFGRWRHSAFKAELFLLWIVEEVDRVPYSILFDLARVFHTRPAEGLLFELLPSDSVGVDHAFEVLLLLVSSRLSVRSRQLSVEFPEVANKMVIFHIVQLIDFMLDRIFLVFLIVAVLSLDQMLVTEAFIELNFSVQPHPHRQVFSCFHVILLVNRLRVKHIGSIVLQLLLCAPVVAFHHVSS